MSNEYLEAREALASELFGIAYGPHTRKFFTDMPQYIQDEWRTKALDLRTNWSGSKFFVVDNVIDGKRQASSPSPDAEVIYMLHFDPSMSAQDIKKHIHQVMFGEPEVEQPVNGAACKNTEAADDPNPPATNLFTQADVYCGKQMFAMFAQYRGIKYPDEYWGNLPDRERKAWFTVGKYISERDRRFAALKVELNTLNKAVAALNRSLNEEVNLPDQQLCRHCDHPEDSHNSGFRPSTCKVTNCQCSHYEQK